MSSEPGAGSRASRPTLAVYGASGLAGSALCRSLIAAGAEVRLVGRSRGKLEATAATLRGHGGIHVAAVEDRAALVAAFVGARAVVNAAGPYARLGDTVVTSAIACGSHYLDLCDEQPVLRHVFEHCDAAARHAQVAVVPGAAFAVTMGDLLAASAAATLLDHHDEGPTVRQIAARRLASPAPLTVSVGYLFDDLSLSPGAQASVFANLGAPMVAWRRDRWDEQRPGRRQRVFNPGPAPDEPGAASAAPAAPGSPAPRLPAGPYQRDAFAIGGGDNLTIPRHIAAAAVDTYLSLSRRPAVHRALRLATMAASLLPARAASVLAPSAPAQDAYAATRYAVVATVEQPFDLRHAIAHGHDVYATSTAITARLAMGLAARHTGPSGVLAPAEVVRAPAFLAELANDGVLVLR